MLCVGLPVHSRVKTTLTSKLAGMESTFDPLLAKARFEEALLQDLPAVAGTAPKSPLKDTPRKPYRTPTKPTNQHAVVASSDQECLQDKGGNQCYHCHGTGDYQRNCLCEVVLCQQCLRNGTLELDKSWYPPKLPLVPMVSAVGGVTEGTHAALL